MHKSEFGAFNTVWCAAWEQAGRNLTPNAIQLAFSALQKFEMAQIRKALMIHITDPKLGRNPPTVADIFRSLQPSIQPGGRVVMRLGGSLSVRSMKRIRRNSAMKSPTGSQLPARSGKYKIRWGHALLFVRAMSDP